MKFCLIYKQNPFYLLTSSFRLLLLRDPPVTEQETRRKRKVKKESNQPPFSSPSIVFFFFAINSRDLQHQPRGRARTEEGAEETRTKTWGFWPEFEHKNSQGNPKFPQVNLVFVIRRFLIGVLKLESVIWGFSCELGFRDWCLCFDEFGDDSIVYGLVIGWTRLCFLSSPLLVRFCDVGIWGFRVFWCVVVVRLILMVRTQIDFDFVTWFWVFRGIFVDRCSHVCRVWI